MTPWHRAWGLSCPPSGRMGEEEVTAARQPASKHTSERPDYDAGKSLPARLVVTKCMRSDRRAGSHFYAGPAIVDGHPLGGARRLRHGGRATIGRRYRLWYSLLRIARTHLRDVHSAPTECVHLH